MLPSKLWIQSGVRKRLFLAVGLLSFMAPQAAFAVGGFEDVGRISGFLRAPQGAALMGSITRADAQGSGVSIFSLAGYIPVRTSVLLQPELPYMTLAREDEVADGFGDIRLRAKARVWSGNRKALFLVSSFRFGSGTAQLFPYSTASNDIEFGGGFVDSLGTHNDKGVMEPLRSLSYWVRTTAVYVIRLNDRLEQADLHGDYATLGGGVVAPLSRRFGLEIGAMGFFFKSGAVRELYFTEIGAVLSPSMSLFVTLQGERGDWRDRAVDASAGVGLKVHY